MVNTMFVEISPQPYANFSNPRYSEMIATTMTTAAISCRADAEAPVYRGLARPAYKREWPEQKESS